MNVLITTPLFLAFVLGAAVEPTHAAAAPPARQPPGLWLPMVYVKARDADTIEACVTGSAFVFALRLIDVWSPELDSQDAEQKRIAKAGKVWVHNKCLGQSLLVFVPFTQGTYPLKALTFDRIPAWVYVGSDDTTLNELVVKEGLASTKKGGALGH